MKKLGFCLAFFGHFVTFFGLYRVAFPVDIVFDIGWKNAWAPGASITCIGVLAITSGLSLVFLCHHSSKERREA